MSSILALSFTAAGPAALGAWPLTAEAEPSFTSYPLAANLVLEGFGPPATHGWRPAPGEIVRIDADEVSASFGEFSLDVWLGAASIVEPIALIAGDGFPVELSLVAGTSPGNFQAIASVQTSGAPVVLLSGDLAVGAAGAPARLGVWVSGSDVLLTFQGATQRRLRFARSVADTRGEIVVGGPDDGSTSTVDVVAVWARDELDAAQDAELARAAAEGIGEIDSLIASGTVNGLGAPEGAEQVLGLLRWRVFQHGAVYWSAKTGAHAVFTRLLTTYTQAGGATGRLGLPTSPEMGLDDLLTWLRVPRGFSGSGLRGADVFSPLGRLDAADLVIEHARPKKPGPRPRESGRWDSLIDVDPRLSEARIQPTPALDADWVAGILGHVDEDDGRVGWRERVRRGRGEDDGPVLIRWARGNVRPGRRGGAVGAGRGGAFGARRGEAVGAAQWRLSAALEAGGFATLRESVNRVADAAGGVEIADALWGAAEPLGVSEAFSVSDAARARVVQAPTAADGWALKVAPPPAFDSLAAAAVRDRLGATPDEVVAISSEALQDFAAGISDALERGEVSAAQASAIAPRLVLRNATVTEFIGADDALQTELGGRADDGAIGDLIAQSMRTGVEFHLEVAGAIWALVGPRAQLFQHGALISTANGAFEIGEHILSHWVLLGGSRGLLGAPRGSEGPVIGGSNAWADAGRWAPFAGGRIYWSVTTGAHEVHGAILGRYLERSSSAVALFVPTIGELLGLPLTDEQPVEGIAGARTSAFLRGRIYWSAATGAWEVYPEILSQLNADGGVGAWGLPTGPQSIRVNGGQRLITQPFQRGVVAILVKDGVTRVLDSLEVVIAKITAGDIDDDTLFIRDRDAELIVRARVWADGAVVLDRTTGRGGRIHAPGWVSAAVDPRSLGSLRILMEAWDYDRTNDNDLLAVVDVTYGYDDGFFGYALGDAWGMRSASDRRGDALAPVVFEYTIGRDVQVSLEKLREEFFWQVQNTGRKELPWRMYRDSFDDIDADTRASADPFERGIYDSRYQGIGDGGNCAGFSVTTIDAFLRRDLVQPLADANLRIEPDNLFWQKINEGQGRQLASTVLSWRADGTDDDDFCDPRRVFTRVEAILKGTSTPVILFFWFKKDKDNKGGHAVLVWRCVVQGSKRIMYLADSNYPFPNMNDFNGSRIEIESDGSYMVFPQDDYGDWGGGAWASGSLGDEYMIEVPYGLYARPLLSPAFDLGSGFLGLLGGVFSATGASVEQVSSGSRRLYGDQRPAVVDRIRDRSELLDALVAVGMAKKARPPADELVITGFEGRRLAAAVDTQRMTTLAETLAPGLRGAALEDRLGEALRLLPGATAAGSVWNAAERPDFDIHLEVEGIGSWLSPGAWPGVADVTPADDRTDSGALIAFRGAVPDQVVTQLRGRGETYRMTMMGRSGVVTVGASLAEGAVDSVQALALSGVRAGIVIDGAVGDRIASLSLEAPIRGGASVGWSVPLGLGTESASVRWLAGRPGIEIQHASAVPSGPVRWGGLGDARVYAAPSATPGERVRVMPDDPASPFGAIRLQRRSAVGDVIETEVIEPAG